MLKTILAIVAAVSVMSMAVAAEKSAAKADKAEKICEKTGKACTGGKNAAHNCKKGDKEWLREYDLAGELILREKSRVHQVKITGIAGWGDIEYRLVLLEPPAGMDGLRRPMHSPRAYKEVFTPVKTLSNPDKKEFSFLLFGDTQLSFNKNCQSVEQRRAFLKKMRSFPEYKKADFLVHIGDTDSYIHDIEKYLLTDMFDDFASTIFSEIQRHRDIIINTTNARDCLLPKLMNGEIAL